MIPAADRLSPRALQLLAVLDEHGALRLNSTPRFPNVSDCGGTWGHVMELVCARQCYVSRLVDGQTTYLSIPMAEACITLFGGKKIEAADSRVYSELEHGPLEAEELAMVLHTTPGRARESLNRLQQYFLVTVHGPGRKLNVNWDTYVWCTREQWQTECSRYSPIDSDTALLRLHRCLEPYLSPVRIKNLIVRLT